MRTATATLAPLWAHGGRCSRDLAAALAQRLNRTQQRNARAQRSHRQRTLRRLHQLGICLKDLAPCKWSHT